MGQWEGTAGPVVSRQSRKPGDRKAVKLELRQKNNDHAIAVLRQAKADCYLHQEAWPAEHSGLSFLAQSPSWCVSCVSTLCPVICGCWVLVIRQV